MDFLRYWLGRLWGVVYLDRAEARRSDEMREQIIEMQTDIGKRIERWREQGVADVKIVDHLADVFAHWPDKSLTAPWELSFGGVVYEINRNIASHQQVRPK